MSCNTIKHLNIMEWTEERENEVEIICRGCYIRNRQYLWESFAGSISSLKNREINNSYLSFEEEPDNEYDPNAIMVVTRGEIFGMLGYVGKEYTSTIKEILGKCCKYRIDMVDDNQIGEKEISLKVSWNEEKNKEPKKRGRPRNDNKLHGIRCNEEEFLAIKEFLKKYRAKKLSEAERIKKLEAIGQKKLKF